MIRVSIQEGTGDLAFAALKAEWQELFAGSTCPPFLAWEWMSVWFESFGENKQPVIFKAYREDKLIGILPMFLEKRRVLGMRMNRLSLMGEAVGGADYLDIIATPDNGSDALSAILDFLEREHFHDLMRFDHVADASTVARILRERVKRRGDDPSCRVAESFGAVCPRIDLSKGWDSVLINSKRATNFKRRLKKLEKMAGFEYRSVTSPEQVGAAFERFLKLHEKRWERAGGSELSGHPRLANFQRRIVQEVAQTGLVRFEELWLEGECRSSIYGFDNGATFYLFNSGYDLDYAHLSVGRVLLGISIRHAVDRGNIVYDFLRGNEEYKFDWANGATDLITFSLSSGQFPGRAHEWLGQRWADLQKGAKTALPSGTAATLGNWRRAWKRSYQMSGR